jgi:hypothetical protein
MPTALDSDVKRGRGASGRSPDADDIQVHTSEVRQDRQQLLHGERLADWLVVSGTTARYEGLGTVNGVAAVDGHPYRFLLSAGDGSPDTFRIQVWWEDDLAVQHTVYDNGSQQAIGSGSIVVHTAK